MDIIHIKNLPIRCCVGVSDVERRSRQKIFVTIALHTDLSRAGESDDLSDTIDYAMLSERIERDISAEQHHLLEALARRIAGICLSEKGVRAVDVLAEKRNALSSPVAVEIHRSNP